MHGVRRLKESGLFPVFFYPLPESPVNARNKVKVAPTDCFPGEFKTTGWNRQTVKPFWVDPEFIGPLKEEAEGLLRDQIVESYSRRNLSNWSQSVSKTTTSALS